MGALLRTELLTEVLPRLAAELLVSLGWRGTAVLVLATVVAHALRRGDREAPVPRTAGVNLACVATVLLALLLIGAD